MSVTSATSMPKAHSFAVNAESGSPAAPGSSSPGARMVPPDSRAYPRGSRADSCSFAVNETLPLSYSCPAFAPLETLRRKQALIKDRIRSVVHQEANGVYLHGRPGSSKTYLIRTTLEGLGQRYAYSNGFVTPVGLFDLIEENPQSVIVLDDVSTIFEQPKALQILLAALGTAHHGSRTRTVRYKTNSMDRVAYFEGSIIAISNLQLAGHSNQVLDALQDRVHVVGFEPTDEEMEAAIYEIASTSPRAVDSGDAIRVAQVLIGQCRTLGVRPSMRLFLDKALGDFRLWRSGRSESHWHDLLHAGVQQSVVPQEHELRDITRTEQIEAERCLVRDIVIAHTSREDRLKAWSARTGKGQSSFYRRMEELKRASSDRSPRQPARQATQLV